MRGNRVLGHGAIYVVGTVLQRGLSLLLLPFVTRILSVEEYGLVGTATAIALLLAIIYGLGLNFSIVRTYYDDPPDAPATGWSALLRVQALVALVLAGVTYATGPLWSQLFEDFGWTSALKVAVLYAYVNAMQTTAQGILRAARRPMAFVSVSFVQLGIGAGLGIALATTWGAAGYLAGMTIGSAVAVLVSLTLSYRRPKWDLAALRLAFTLGIPFMFHYLASWGLNLSDRLILAFYLSLEEVGRYQVAYVLASAMALLMGSLQQAWAPHFLGDLTEEARRRTPPALVLPVTALTIAATALLVLAGPLIIRLLAPAEYGGTELVIALVASVAIARAPYFVSVVVLLDQRNTKIMATSSVAGALVNVGLNLALIPVFGVEAAAATTSVAFALQAGLVIWRTQQALGTSMHLVRLALLWAAGLAGMVAIGLLPSGSATGVAVRAVVIVPVLIGGWLAVQWLRRAVAREEREAEVSPTEHAPQPA